MGNGDTSKVKIKEEFFNEYGLPVLEKNYWKDTVLKSQIEYYYKDNEEVKRLEYNFMEYCFGKDKPFKKDSVTWQKTKNEITSYRYSGTYCFDFNYYTHKKLPEGVTFDSTIAYRKTSKTGLLLEEGVSYDKNGFSMRRKFYSYNKKKRIVRSLSIFKGNGERNDTSVNIFKHIRFKKKRFEDIEKYRSQRKWYRFAYVNEYGKHKRLLRQTFDYSSRDFKYNKQGNLIEINTRYRKGSGFDHNVKTQVFKRNKNQDIIEEYYINYGDNFAEGWKKYLYEYY